MGRQRILIIALNYAPERVGAGKYTAEMATWLAARGHDVRVLSAPPYYPAWRVSEGYRAWTYRREKRDGVRILRCPLYVPAEPGALPRIVHLLTFGLSATLGLLFLLLRRGPYPQWVVVVAPTMTSIPGALLFARFTGASTWLHVQDFEIGAAQGVEVLASGRAFLRGLRWIERTLFRRFNRVSTISRSMFQRLLNLGLNEGQAYMLPNGLDCSQFGLGDKSVRRARARHGIDEQTCLVLFAGTMNLKQNLEVVVEAARKLLVQKHIVFLLCGEGPERVRLKLSATGLHNVHWLESQDDAQFTELLVAASIHLLPQRADVAPHVMPSKLGPMLASGRPVVATALPGTDIAELISDCGVLTPPGDAQAFADAIQALSVDHSLRERLGQRARNVAQRSLNRNELFARFEQELL